MWIPIDEIVQGVLIGIPAYLLMMAGIGYVILWIEKLMK